MSKRIGNIKRLLVAMGIGFLSVCTLNQMASAAPSGVVGHYRDNFEDNKIRYEITLTETTEGGATPCHLDEIYYTEDDTKHVLDIITGSMDGNISNTQGGGFEEIANIVVDVPNTVTELTIANDNETQ